MYFAITDFHVYGITAKTMRHVIHAKTGIIGSLRIYQIMCLMQNLLPCGIALIVKIILIDYKQRRI